MIKQPEVYSYEVHRERLFTEEGKEHFHTFRGAVQIALNVSGAFQAGRFITNYNRFLDMACIDLLLEMGEIREIEQPDNFNYQDMVFVKGKS